MSTITFDRLSEYHRLLEQALSQAKRNICWFDVDLSACDADRSSVVAALQHLLAGDPASHIKLLLHHTSYLQQHCPRLIQLLRSYGHVFKVRTVAATHHSESQNWLLIDDNMLIRRYHHEHFRGEQTQEASVIGQYRQYFESMWETASVASPGQSLSL